MSTFIAISKEIISIEPFDVEDAYQFELPAGYGTVGGEKLKGDQGKSQVVTIAISPGRIIKCLVDFEVMGFSEGQEVKVIMGGNNAACLVNIEEKKYVYFNKSLRAKYTIPRVMSGINMAMVAAVGGYILVIIMQHSQLKMGTLIAQGAGLALFMASITYSLYYYFNNEPAHTKLRQYLKKLLN